MDGISETRLVFIADVGDALDPPSGSRGRRLKFVGTRPGRRANPLKMIANSKIRMSVAIAKRRLHKPGQPDQLEAAVAEAAEKLGISRASIFRALNRRPESHKKR